MRRQLGRLAILTTLGIATLAYGSLEKRVIVHIEGTPVAVRTFAGTVAGALERAGVEVGVRDLVVPSPATTIVEGSVIRVRRAKPVRLVVDGHKREVVVTGLTVQDALREAEVEGTLVDRVDPPRRARVKPGMTISYRRAVPIVVKHDGKRKKVVTNASTVRAVVDELGIELGKRDFLAPRGSEKPEPSMRLRVMRVGVKKVTKKVEVGYGTTLRRQSNLEYGVRKVIQEGRSGLKQIRVRIKYVNGEPQSRKIIKEDVLRKPVQRIIAIGAGYPGCTCKTGTEAGSATWYRQIDGMTAAHKTLPFGTVVRVENVNTGKSINVRIVDRGPYAEGRIIDLSDEAFRQLAPLSKGVIPVRIAW